MTFSDLRLAIRMLRRRPVLAVGAVLSLALGIGANTAIFSVLHRVILNPLPYQAPEELVVVWETSPDNEERWVAPANFVDWRRETTSFAALAAFDEFRPTMRRVSRAAEPEVVRAVSASGNFFVILGADAALGRTLIPEDDRPNAGSVAVLSEGLWERAFGGAADVTGRVLALDGRQYTIVGVMPRGFESPLQTAPVDLWVNGDRGVPNTSPLGGDVTTVRDSHIINVVGRLRTGVSREVAQQELTALMQDLARRYPETNAGLGVNVKSLHAQVVGDVSRVVMLLQLAVGAMLLIACANVAHLLLGQAVARQTEMTTRAALGAGRWRLVRQLFAETLVIAVPGGVLGVFLATWGLDLIVGVAPQGLPRLGEIGIDRTVLAFTTAVTLLTACLFGLGPAWQLSKNTSIARMQSTTRLVGARSVRRWHHAVVIVELAAAHVLLVGAGLLVTSLLAAERVELGFESDGRVAAELNLAPERYLVRTDERGRINITPKLQFVERVLTRMQQTPGVRSAAAALTAPLAGAPNRGIVVEGRSPAGPGVGDTADFQVVTPDFFRTVGAAFIGGRQFMPSDTAGSRPVAIINQTFAARYFAGQDPLGRKIQFGGDIIHEIVGVVSDMRYRSVEATAEATFYLPMTQNTERWGFLSFLVWTEGDTRAALTSLRTAIRDADGNQAVARLASFDEMLSTALRARRFTTVLVAAFAASALLLAAIGTYAVMSFAVSMRTRELGVRAALGATPRQLMHLVLRGSAVLTAAAIGLGLAAAFVTTGLLRTLLFGVSPRDPATFVLVGLTLAVVAVVATWLPARRAIAVGPARALKHG